METTQLINLLCALAAKADAYDLDLRDSPLLSRIGEKICELKRELLARMGMEWPAETEIEELLRLSIEAANSGQAEPDFSKKLRSDILQMILARIQAHGRSLELQCV